MMNKRKTPVAVTVLLIGLLGASNAFAMRCGTHLIARGDHVSKLLRYCGDPEFTQSRSSQRSFHNQLGQVLYAGFYEEVRIDEWTYNFGPTKLMRIVVMENGVVTTIRHLGYGYIKR